MPEALDCEMFPKIHYVVFRKCTPAWTLPEHSTGAANLTYLIKGDALYTINGTAVELTQGSLLSLPANNVRKGITFPDRVMQCFSADFDLTNIKKQIVPLPFPLTSLPGLHEDIIRMFHDLAFAWSNKIPGYIIKSSGLFLQIIHRFLELVVFKDDLYSEDTRITKVIRYMAAHYSERITAKMMAEMVGLNPNYFGSLFRKIMKVSFNHYLVQTRVRNAEHMLSGGEYNVGNVAEACGFSDSVHFYKQFKHIKGFPPSYSLPRKF